MISFSSYIAKRYLFSKSGVRFSFFLTVTAVLGVAVGTAALIVVLSVMSGFSRDLEERVSGFEPHITIEMTSPSFEETINTISSHFRGIAAIEPYVTGEIIVRASVEDQGSSAAGAKVLGLREIPERMRKNAHFYWKGSGLDWPWWSRATNPLSGGVIIGQELLYQIGVNPDFDTTIQLITPFGSVDPLGNPSPLVREYPVAGSFKSGFFEYDLKYIVLPIAEAQRLLGDYGRYGLQVMLTNPAAKETIARELQSFLGDGYHVESWSEKNKRLFGALKLERMAMTCLLFLVMGIASFSIVGVSLMIFFGKRRDLGLLTAMGASKREISRIFLFHGGGIGLCGAGIGALLGLGVSVLIARGHVALPPSYYLEYLPVDISLLQVLLIVAAGWIVSVGASYYPSRRAAQIDPVRLLRYE